MISNEHRNKIMHKLQNKSAIITGGARGIGAAIARLFAQAGAKVIIADIDAENGTRLAAELSGQFFHLDVSSEKDWDLLAAAHPVIDIVVNNAGITRDATMIKMTFEQWDEVIRVDLTGCFNMAKAVFAGMRERKWGRIVNIGSVNGQGGQIGQVNYAAAKGALNSATKALALEVGSRGVTVNAIAPTVFRSPLTAWMFDDTDNAKAVRAGFLARVPKGRLGEPEDLAGPLLFLASRASDFYTGHILYADGGYTAG
jgi:acetoacetyl-CoA reductase